MTTIAFDGRTMAGDSQQYGDFIDRFYAEKITFSEDRKILIGGGGNVESSERLRSWFLAGADLGVLPKLDASDDTTLMIVQGGRVFDMGRTGYLVEVGSPYAIGSGASYAMGAMLAGADARQAVEIAIKLDPNSGGKITVLNIEDQENVSIDQLSPTASTERSD